MSRDQSDIKEFLESGLLEQYLIGATDEETSRRIEFYIDTYEEVRKEWDIIQDSLETMALSTEVKAPDGIHAAIKSQIASDPASALASQSGNATIRRMSRMVVAASIVAFLFATIAIAEWISLSRYKEQVAELTEMIKGLESEQVDQNKRFARLESEFILVNDPNTRKAIITGNDQASDFVLVAYWNNTNEASAIQVASHPALPDGQCFQLWADVHGEMVSLGVIPQESGLLAIDYKADAESLNVTIEPEGGSDHPTVSRLVGSVQI